MSNTNNRPQFKAFIKVEGKTKSTWIRVGSAFQIKDGKGLSVKLNALPTDGQIFLFEPKSETNSASSQ